MIGRLCCCVAGFVLLGLAETLYAVEPRPLENAYWRFEEGTAGNYVPAGPDTVLDSPTSENDLRWFSDNSGSLLSARVEGNTVRDPAKGGEWTPANKWVGFFCVIGGTNYLITASTVGTADNPATQDVKENELDPATLTLDGTPPQGGQNYEITKYLPAPTYTTDVPVSIIPQTGEPNTLALHFAPNDDIYTDNDHIENPLADAMTIEAAFKPETVTAFQGIIGKDGKPLTAAPEQTWVLKVRGDTGNLQVEFFDRSGTRRSIESGGPLAVNQWYYAAVVSDLTTCSLYLDRRDGAGYVLQGTTPVSGGPIWQGTSGGDFESTWTIGRGMHNNNITDWFAGVIDEVRISNRALDPTEFLFFFPYAQGDFDKDGDVDGQDFQQLKLCNTGPAIPYTGGNVPAACPQTPDEHGLIPADLDKDSDVDHDDFGMFQANYTG